MSLFIRNLKKDANSNIAIPSPVVHVNSKSFKWVAAVCVGVASGVAMATTSGWEQASEWGPYVKYVHLSVTVSTR